MAYTSIPSQSDGNILGASYLNTLKSNIEFFHSIVSGINTPFCGEFLDLGGVSRPYSFRHQGRYLHYKFRLTSGDSDEVVVRVDGNTEYNDATNRASPYSWTGYIDLQATTANPAVGDWYEVTAQISFNPNGEFHVDYFIESDSTTL